MRTLSSDKRTRRIAADSALLGAALLLAFVESLLPLGALPIPGCKLGLANIAVVITAYRLSIADAAVVSGARILITFLLFGSPTSALFSALGGALVILMLAILQRTALCTRLSYIGVSVLCAAAHNAGQLIAAMLLTGPAVIGYLPVLAAASLFYGAVTGILLNLLPPILTQSPYGGTV